MEVEVEVEAILSLRRARDLIVRQRDRTFNMLRGLVNHYCATPVDTDGTLRARAFWP